MPMTFPTFESLTSRAAQRKFRLPHPDETEEQYRTAFADFMQDVDMVEAAEIRLGRMPMDFVVEADPLMALSALMGKSRDDVQGFMNDFFAEPLGDTK